MGMFYELDEVEKDALLRMVVQRVYDDLNDDQPLPQKCPRAGEKVQKFWCAGCETWHEGSVLGGPIEHVNGNGNAT